MIKGADEKEINEEFANALQIPLLAFLKKMKKKKKKIRVVPFYGLCIELWTRTCGPKQF